MTSPIPVPFYPSNAIRTQADMQTYFETMLSIAKEQIGGTGEAASVQLASNTFTPGNNACVCPIDTNGGGPTDTLNTIQTTNIRDGEVIFVRSTNSARVITITNTAGGAGEIFTADGNNIVLNSTKLFVALKYNLAITAFEELFRTSATPNLSSPGPIGNTTPNTGEFTTLTLTGSVGAHTWLGNNTSSTAAPTFQSITSGDLPATSVNFVSNLSPIFSAAISAQALSFTLTNANAGTLFGNFGSAAAAPSYNAPGSNNQVLGVTDTGSGLEYKTITAGTGITITPTAGAITIAATGGSGFTNPMTALGDAIYGASGGAATRLAGNTTATKQFLNQTGTGSVSAAPVWAALSSSDIPWASPGTIGSTTPNSASFTTVALTGSVAGHKWLGNNTGSSAAPSFESITSADLPATTVNSAGNLSPLFTAAISSQAINFSLSNAAAGSLLGNASGSSAAPAYIAPGSNDQLLSVVHSGTGLEYKSLIAGSNITITPSAGSITIASTGGLTNPMTTLGDIIYGGTGGAPTRLAGNTSSARELLISAGTGSAAATPSWGALNPADIPIVTCGGRLYPVAGSPWADGSSSGNSTIYFGPANSIMGNLITIGSTLQAFAQTSLALTATADTAYYIYVTSASSTTVAMGLLAWTNQTTPPTTYTRNGQLYADSAFTELIVGGFNCRVANTVFNWTGERALSNYFNQIQMGLLAQDSTTSWATTSTTPIAANNSTVNGIGQLQVFTCVQREPVQVRNFSLSQMSGGVGSPILAIYLDGAQATRTAGTASTASYDVALACSFSQSQLGLHTYARYNAVSTNGAYFFGVKQGYMEGSCFA